MKIADCLIVDLRSEKMVKDFRKFTVFPAVVFPAVRPSRSRSPAVSEI